MTTPLKIAENADENTYYVFGAYEGAVSFLGFFESAQDAERFIHEKGNSDDVFYDIRPLVRPPITTL